MKTHRDFSDKASWQAWKAEEIARRMIRPKYPTRVETVFVQGPERVIEVERIVEVPAKDGLEDVLARMEAARENLAEADQAASDGPPPGFEDLARETEAWSETAEGLLDELVKMRNQMMGGWLPDESRDRMARLERLFAAKKPPKFERAG
ncbi:MAG: hypothetical protein AAGJ50_01530 [Pseudomonadota bacterium]